MRTSDKNPLLTCLLEGPAGTGKTALAATVGLDSQFPFVKLITAETMVGFSEAAKSNQIAKVFDDAYRVSLLFCAVCMSAPIPLSVTLLPYVSSDDPAEYSALKYDGLIAVSLDTLVDDMQGSGLPGCYAITAAL